MSEDMTTREIAEAATAVFAANGWKWGDLIPTVDMVESALTELFSLPEDALDELIEIAILEIEC